MTTRVLALELPDEIVALLGSPETAASRARQALVLELLREGRIGQGMAAELLDLSRAELLDLMVRRRILSGPETGEEATREIEALRRVFDEREPRGGDQRQ